MQTFLPYENFKESARCLDYRRLGKQRVEAKQLLELMSCPEKTAWRNHPCFKMWDGYDLALALYGLRICEEWRGRGYRDNLVVYFREKIDYPIIGNEKFPDFIGCEKYHSSHRSALLYKDYDFYSQYGWSEKPAIPLKITKNSVTLPYVWEL